MGIVYAILNAEKKSALYPNPNGKLSLDKLNNTWYFHFAKILFDLVQPDNLEDLFNHFSIVCFNYDRCIQHFLINALCIRFDISNDRARELVKDLKIYHPYGSIGNLPMPGLDKCIKFGESFDYLNLLDLSQSIKTFTEQIEEGDLLNNIRQEVTEAETIVFLGFGYHKQNMSILAPSIDNISKRIYATAIGISDPDKSVIEDQIYSTLRLKQDPDYRIRILDSHVRNDLTCAALFSEYQRTLTAN
jgi:hypothetical protein